MSRYVPKKHNSKRAQIDWCNALVHLHDLQCDCESPLEHTIVTINHQEKDLKFTDAEKARLQKWLTTTEEDGAPGDHDDIGAEDLERLFETDIGDEKENTDTG